MAKKPFVGEDGAGEILAEARRVLDARDGAALARKVTFDDLAGALDDDFDPSFTAERVLALLAPDLRRALKARLSADVGRLDDQDGGGVTIHLPADLAARLREIDEQPLAAIRALVEGKASLSEPGSEEFCRTRRCAPQILLSDPGGWTCQSCGLTGRVDQPFNDIIGARLAEQKGRIAELHALATAVYESWGAGGRFTAADCAARRILAGRGDRDRVKLLLPELVHAGLLEEAPGPRGGAGYRILDEAPDWLADALEEGRRQREAETRAREEQAAALRRVLDEGLSYTTRKGAIVEVSQSERGLELSFPALPGWELRELLKRQGHCRWDARRRRWCRSSPVTSVEPWLAAALDEGAEVEPLGTADPDAEDWAHGHWPD